jgi:hypothetical protein
MAQYTIDYACGHGSVVKNLTGKHADRESYIAWAKDNLLCPECYAKAKAEADDRAERRAVIKLDIHDGKRDLVVEVEGGRQTNAALLDELGARTSRDRWGITTITYRLTADRATMIAWINRVGESLQGSGYRVQSLVTKAEALAQCDAIQAEDAAAVAQVATQIAAKDAIVAARPAWYQAILDKYDQPRWNGKIYGKPGKYSIYISNVEHKITDEQAADLRAYQALRDKR